MTFFQVLAFALKLAESELFELFKALEFVVEEPVLSLEVGFEAGELAVAVVLVHY